MTRYERAVLPWQCTLGSKSHINLLGKILLLPFIVIVAGTFSALELMFSSDAD